MRFISTLTQKFETTLSEAHDFAFVLLLELGLSLDLTVRNVPDIFNNILGLANQADERLVFGLEKLQQGPNGNVLEGGVTRLQEAAEVSVNALVGLVPVLYENRVIANYIYMSDCVVLK